MKKALFVSALALLLALSFSPAHAIDIVEMEDYCIVPPYVQSNVAPNILLMMDNSEFNGQWAYEGVSSKDPVVTDAYTYKLDGQPPVDAPGLFRQELWYSWDGNKFMPDASGVFEGNLLNWATTSIYDIIEGIIVGGKSASRQTNAHTLLGYSSGVWPRQVYVYKGTDNIMYACEFAVNVGGKGDLTIMDSFEYKGESYGYECGLIKPDPKKPAAGWRFLSSADGLPGQPVYAKQDSSPDIDRVSLISGPGLADEAASIGAEDVPAITLASAVSHIPFSGTGADNVSGQGAMDKGLGLLNFLIDSVAVPAYAAPAPKTLITIMAPSDGATLPAAKLHADYPPVYAQVSFSVVKAPCTEAVAVWTATGLPNGIFINSTTGVIMGKPYDSAQLGTNNIDITATATTCPDSDTVSVTMELSETAFSIIFPQDGTKLHSGAVGRPYSGYRASATGGTGSYTWSATDLPLGMTIDPVTGLISGTPDVSDQTKNADGSLPDPIVYNITIEAYDGFTTVTHSNIIEINSRALYISTFADEYLTTITNAVMPSAEVREFYSLSLAASGGSGNYTWDAAGLPAGLTLDQNTGLISGTPSGLGLPAGEYKKEFKVDITVTDLETDGHFGYVQSENGSYVSLTVYDYPVEIIWPHPDWTSIYSRWVGVVIANEYYDSFMKVAAKGGNESAYVWTATGLPAGLSIDPGTGLISGTPNGSPETYHTAIISVTDGSSSAAVAIDIYVTSFKETSSYILYPMIDSELTIIEQFLDGYYRQPYAVSPVITGGMGDVTWALTGGFLPSGLSLDSATGLISGTPTQYGVFDLTLTAYNSIGGEERLVEDSLALYNSAGLPVGSGDLLLNTPAMYNASGGIIATLIDARRLYVNEPYDEIRDERRPGSFDEPETTITDGSYNVMINVPVTSIVNVPYDIIVNEIFAKISNASYGVTTNEWYADILDKNYDIFVNEMFGVINDAYYDMTYNEQYVNIVDERYNVTNNEQYVQVMNAFYNAIYNERRIDVTDANYIAKYNERRLALTNTTAPVTYNELRMALTNAAYNDLNNEKRLQLVNKDYTADYNEKRLQLVNKDYTADYNEKRLVLADGSYDVINNEQRLQLANGNYNADYNEYRLQMANGDYNAVYNEQRLEYANGDYTANYNEYWTDVVDESYNMAYNEPYTIVSNDEGYWVTVWEDRTVINDTSYTETRSDIWNGWADTSYGVTHNEQFLDIMDTSYTVTVNEPYTIINDESYKEDIDLNQFDVVDASYVDMRNEPYTIINDESYTVLVNEPYTIVNDESYYTSGIVNGIGTQTVDMSYTETRYEPYTIKNDESYTEVRNEPFISIINEAYAEWHNEPYAIINDESYMVDINEPYTIVNDMSYTATVNEPYTIINDESYTATVNEPYTEIKDEKYQATVNEPYTIVNSVPYTAKVNEPYTKIEDKKYQATVNEPYTIINDESYTAKVNEPITVVNSEAFTAEVNEPYTIINDESYTADVNEPYTIINDESYVVKENEPYTIKNDVSYTITENEPYTIINDESYTYNVNEPFTVINDVSYTITENEPYTIINDESYTITENEPYTIINDESYTEWVDEKYYEIVDKSYIEVRNEPYTEYYQVLNTTTTPDYPGHYEDAYYSYAKSIDNYIDYTIANDVKVLTTNDVGYTVFNEVSYVAVNAVSKYVVNEVSYVIDNFVTKQIANEMAFVIDNTVGYNVVNDVSYLIDNSVTKQIANYVSFLIDNATVGHNVVNMVAYLIDNSASYTVTNDVSYVIDNTVGYTVINDVSYLVDNSASYTITNYASYVIDNAASYWVANHVSSLVDNSMSYTIANDVSYFVDNTVSYWVTNDVSYFVANSIDYTVANFVSYFIDNSIDYSVANFVSYFIDNSIDYSVANFVSYLIDNSVQYWIANDVAYTIDNPLGYDIDNDVTYTIDNYVSYWVGNAVLMDDYQESPAWIQNNVEYLVDRYVSKTIANDVPYTINNSVPYAINKNGVNANPTALPADIVTMTIANYVAYEITNIVTHTVYDETESLISNNVFWWVGSGHANQHQASAWDYGVWNETAYTVKKPAKYYIRNQVAYTIANSVPYSVMNDVAYTVDKWQPYAITNQTWSKQNNPQTYSIANDVWSVPDNWQSYGITNQDWAMQNNDVAYNIANQTWAMQDKWQPYGITNDVWSIVDNYRSYGITNQDWAMQDNYVPYLIANQTWAMQNNNKTYDIAKQLWTVQDNWKNYGIANQNWAMPNNYVTYDIINQTAHIELNPVTHTIINDVAYMIVNEVTRTIANQTGSVLDLDLTYNIVNDVASMIANNVNYGIANYLAGMIGNNVTYTIGNDVASTSSHWATHLIKNDVATTSSIATPYTLLNDVLYVDILNVIEYDWPWNYANDFTRKLVIHNTLDPVNILVPRDNSYALPHPVLQTPYSFRPIAEGGEPPYVWSADNLPPGLSIDTTTGVISGTPTASGYKVVTLGVSDTRGTVDVNNFRIYVSDTPYPMVENLIYDGATGEYSLPDATEGTTYSFQLVANMIGFSSEGIRAASGSFTFSDIDPVSGLNTLPSGMTLDTSTGEVGGMPLKGTAGPYLVTIVVTDESGTSYTHFDINLVVATASVSINSQVFPVKACAADEYYNCETAPPGYEIKHGLLQDYWDEAKFGLTSFNQSEDPLIDQCLPANNDENFYTDVENAIPQGVTKLVDGLYTSIELFVNSSEAAPQCSDVFDADDNSRCRKNYVLMITSGEGALNPPNPDSASTPLVFGQNGKYTMPAGCSGLTSNLGKNACFGTGGELGDVRPDLPGKQGVSTYIVNPMGERGTSKEDALIEAANISDGIYYYASDPAKLRDQLKQALKDIIKRATSGTAASVLASGEGSGANIIQALYYPKRKFKDSQTQELFYLGWMGKLSAFWYYSDPHFTYSDIREDTVRSSPPTLNMSDDLIVQPFFNTVNETTQATLWRDDGGDGSPDVMQGLEDFENVNALWEAGKMLWERDIEQDPRRIYVNIDDTPGTMLIFNAATVHAESTLRDYLNDGGPTYGLINSLAIANYVNGYEVPGKRSRAVKLDVDGDGETNSPGEDRKRVWKLGDVLNSSPSITASRIRSNMYDYDYCDNTYRQFVETTDHYQKRGMAYSGSNDGMLHAFKLGYLQQGEGDIRATLYNSSDYTYNANTSPLGYEKWAFVPKNALPYLKYQMRDDYCHIFTVDQTVTIVDASLCESTYDETTNPDGNTYSAAESGCAPSVPFDPSATKGIDSWRSLLIGGMRYGGACKAQGTICTEDTNGDTVIDQEDCVRIPHPTVGYSSYFALDITDEDNPEFLWEYTHPEMGYSTSGPKIVRFHGDGGSESSIGQWYAVFGSGPTGAIDKSNNQFIGASDQSIKFFVLDLRTGQPAAKMTGDYIAPSTSIDDAYVHTMGKANDFNRINKVSCAHLAGNYQTDVIYSGYIQKCNGLALDNGEACPTETWRNGGILRILTAESDDPDDWTISVMMDNIGPVYSGLASVYDLLQENAWVYAGTGRYFYERNEPWRGISNIVADDRDEVRNIIAVKDPCTFGNPIENPFADPTCTTPVDFGTLLDVTAVPDNTDETGPGWFITLDAPMTDAVTGIKYGAERVVTNLATSVPNQMLSITSFKPYADECKIGGESYLWAVGLSTGGSLGAGLQGVAVMQVSTGAIEKIDLSKDFIDAGGRKTAGMVGVSSIDPPKFAVPGSSVPRLLHILEREQ